MKKTIFEAACAGDVAAVRSFLDGGADVSALSKHGFTALQSAAMGANTAPEADNLEVRACWWTRAVRSSSRAAADALHCF